MVENKKKKILWVVYDFVQAGGQRYVYEICKALNKEKYEIDILKVAPMNHDKNWDSEFYYQPMLDLGCRVLFLSELVKPKVQSQVKRLKQRAAGYLGRVSKLTPGKSAQKKTNNMYERDTLKKLFSGYDHVNFSGVAVYQTVCIHNGLHLANAFIHILSFSFQHEKMYDKYDKELFYNFISPVTPGAVKKDLSGFKNYNYTYYPLCFETNPYDVRKKTGSGKYKIAVFTRLSKMKPLDPYFYALKLLLEQGMDVELNIYGAGNPDSLGLLNQLQYLYINNNIKFMGHVEDIQATLTTNPPHLLWFQSANREPGGYAAFEISMSGLPQLFWDFMDIGESQPIEKVFPSFTALLPFVQYTKEILLSNELQNEIGNKQREYVLKNYSIRDHIHIIEELLDK